jgi:hypothetical protein
MALPPAARGLPGGVPNGIGARNRSDEIRSRKFGVKSISLLAAKP